MKEMPQNGHLEKLFQKTIGFLSVEKMLLKVFSTDKVIQLVEFMAKQMQDTWAFLDGVENTAKLET